MHTAPYTRKNAAATGGLATLLFLAALAAMLKRPVEQSGLRASEPISLRLNPNTADAESLSLLPGIGPGIAQRIVEDRQANGPFSSTDVMQRVPYVGEKTARAIEPWVTFE